MDNEFSRCDNVICCINEAICLHCIMGCEVQGQRMVIFRSVPTNRSNINLMKWFQCIRDKLENNDENKVSFLH